MNLYLRLLWVFIRSLFTKQIDTLDSTRLQFRCMPWDCDINRHLTNSRYASFMDLGRIYLLGSVGLLKIMKQKKWLPVISACDISFFREIKPWSKFQLHSRIVCWDEKYFYIEQQFKDGDALLAVGRVRALLMHKKQKLTPKACLEALNVSTISPEIPASLYRWRHGNKKADNSTKYTTPDH